MQEVIPLVEQAISGCLGKQAEFRLLVQASGMGEEEREEFLDAFEREPQFTHLGCCVMGGIFSEGIDLTNDRLIGAVVVGTGIPMVCRERELFREYYDEAKKAGFEYAYLYGGMNKVLQSAGRVIRTISDRGVILLLDDRFIRADHQVLFPKEWYPHEIITRKDLEGKLRAFWEQ